MSANLLGGISGSKADLHHFDPPVVEWALLDRDGLIVAVNDAWTVFATSNGGTLARTGIGMNYLDVCAADSDDQNAAAVADAIRVAIGGGLPAPMRVLVRCDSPQEIRSFDVLISSRLADDGSCRGASVTLSRAPDPSIEKPDAAGADSLAAGELARLAAEVLAASAFPALVLEVPSERIIASSHAASQLLDPDGGVTVGHLLEEFTADRPTPGLALFAGGRLNGFETFRVLRRGHGPDLKVRMWIRSFDHQPTSPFVLVVIVPDEAAGGSHASSWADAPAVVGTADASLLIERISSGAEELFNQPIDDLLDKSMLVVVAEDDVPNFLVGLSEASASQRGVTIYLNIRSGIAGSAIRCEVLLLPLRPSPSCVFVFLPTAGNAAGGQISGDISAILLRLGRGAHIAQRVRGIFRGITEKQLPGLSRLTTREREIVTLLVDGARVPAIAQKLFLSQSTVRNHLASVFAKLGVASQQYLVDLVHRSQSAPE